MAIRANPTFYRGLAAPAGGSGLRARNPRCLLQRCADIRRFGDLYAKQTGTRLIDWVDHFALPASDPWNRG